MVPVAFSSHTADLINYAAVLAAPFGAELLLVNIINERDIETLERISSYGYNVDEVQYIKEIETERMQDLEKVLENVEYPDERIRTVFKVGHVNFNRVGLPNSIQSTNALIKQVWIIGKIK